VKQRRLDVFGVPIALPDQFASAIKYLLKAILTQRVTSLCRRNGLSSEGHTHEANSSIHSE
jgi:hypothetical protein